MTFDSGSAPQLIEQYRHEFRFTDLVFFNGKLYVGSTLGLLEYDGKKLARIYKWNRESWDTVEDLGHDRANNLLWAFHSRSSKLLRFDGNTWQVMDLPRTNSLPYSRDDMIKGFEPFSSRTFFWLQGSEQAWRLLPENNSWIPVEIPQMTCEVQSTLNDPSFGCFASIAPTQGVMFVIMHSDLVAKMYPKQSSNANKPNPDRILFRDGSEWKDLSEVQRYNLYTKSVVSGDESAFLESNDGELFRIGKAGLSKIESLGKIDAIAVSTSGNLLVCYRDLGIYEYNGAWVKLFDYPYKPVGLDRWTSLAEADGRMALVINFASGDVTDRGRSNLWLSEGDTLVEFGF
jgi:hypothetical protein